MEPSLSLEELASTETVSGVVPDVVDEVKAATGFTLVTGVMGVTGEQAAKMIRLKVKPIKFFINLLIRPVLLRY